MNVNRDVLVRLERLGLRYCVTGSWALSAYAEPRQTRDLDVLLDLSVARYEALVRPTFEDAYVVNNPIVRAAAPSARSSTWPRSPRSIS